MEKSGNPVIDQREAALAAVWPEVVQACVGGVPNKRWSEVQAQLVDRLRDLGFKTKPLGMRGSARYIDAMMRRALKEGPHV